MNLIRAVLIAVVLSFAAAPVADAAPAKDPVCRTTVCKKQMKKWKKARAKYLRIRAAHRRAVRYDQLRWNKIKPYLSWLRVVGDCENADYGGASLKSGLNAYNPSPFFGRYQFTWGTWASVGGHGDPRNADWLEQAYRAILVKERDGSGAWPVCAAGKGL